ncbi:hypothetical protein LTR47_009912 [Exophiala xenobiotica]|nr:hypothetical protein LTR47_009912 [Exophiala xenobiotica]KAK5243937.1 hypothetical protein LTS06_010413 [Exophiala xenobiotica]KAK5282179.1 hypothetical protein LTR40_003661 [Exophiala xenobiotica]KAK5347932.1 hypothetical protein LTR61_008184 [Exophiala xenobiotica]KAK5361459.1 hypothetical protein LTS03_010412 [Exophiala xenobiotica]
MIVTPTQILLAIPPALLLGVSGLILKAVIDYLRDPLDLRKYPAPSIWASIFPFWLMIQTWRGRRFAAIHEGHERLGDVVRLSPTYLVFNIPQAVTDIYGHMAANKIKKAVFYDTLAGEYHDIVQVTDRADHARKRRFLANSFALKNVVRMEPLIRDKVRRLLAQIDRNEQSQSWESSKGFDFRYWFNYFTLDVIGAMGFGLPPGFLDKGKDTTEIWTLDKKSEYTLPSAIYALIGGLRYHVSIGQDTSVATAKLIKTTIRWFPSLWRRLGGHNGIDFENFSATQLRNRLDQGTPKEGISDDFVQSILKDKAGEDRSIPFMELVAESVVIMAAGSATTTGLLTSSLYLLMSNPECMKKLRAEVDGAFPFPSPSSDVENDIIPFDKVRDLPYLRACIDETLRVRPPISIALPRLVYAPEGAMIAGHHILPGTTVAVSPWTIHRNESIYSEPQAYRPERWIPDDKGDLQKQMEIHNLKAYNIPFSQGSRACIGRHIAVVEAQILLATLVRRYNFSLTQENQQLSIFEAFNANPGPLPVKFSRRVTTSADLI